MKECLVLSMLMNGDLSVSVHSNIESAIAQARLLFTEDGVTEQEIKNKVTNLFCKGKVVEQTSDSLITYFLSYASVEDVTQSTSKARAILRKGGMNNR